ncbi:VOC family protein [Roseibium salinum]|nr:VOC family protein [Roseibium salinum]
MSRPMIDGILETSVYVDDMDAAHAFYSRVLGLKRMVSGDRLYAYDAGPAQALLIFHRGHTGEDVETEGGVVPGHDLDRPLPFRLQDCRGSAAALAQLSEGAGGSISSARSPGRPVAQAFISTTRTATCWNWQLLRFGRISIPSFNGF